MFFFLHVETVKGNGCSSGGSYSLRLPLKCEYDETSVNKSDGKAPSYKYVPVFSRCSLFSLSHHHNSFIGFVPCLAKWETKSAFQLLWFKISGTKTRHTSSHPTPSLSLSLFVPLWISVCLPAQRDLPGHRTLQDVPSHGHLETRLWLPGQHQVRALTLPRDLLKSSRNSSPCDVLLQMERMF